MDVEYDHSAPLSYYVRVEAKHSWNHHVAYYDKIAKKWHEITGASGGAFKRFVLNDLLLAEVGSVSGQAVLEVGAGNGYFMPMLLRPHSGRRPARVVITEQSLALLEIAERRFPLRQAEYLHLDVRAPLPFADGDFDLVLATMVFNELSGAGLRRALHECRRVIGDGGRLVMTVTHPDFVRSLSKRGLLRREGRRPLTMPSTDGLRLPVVQRSKRQYESLLAQTAFSFESTDVFPNRKVLSAKPGLRNAGNVALALVFKCMPARKKEKLG